VRPDSRIFALSAATSSSDQGVVDAPGTGSCQSRSSAGTQRAEVALLRAHVAVGQLVPGAGEGVGELGRVVEPSGARSPRRRVDAQRDVGGQHRDGLAVELTGLRVGDVVPGAVLGHELPGTRRALGELVLVAEQVLEVLVRSTWFGSSGPGDLEAGGDRVAALAGAEALLPAEALLLDGRALGLGTDVLVGVGRTVGLAEGVPARDERDGLLVVHRHPAEGLADVARRAERVGVGVGALGVDVDQAHLDGAERLLELAVTGVALVAQPGALRAPVDVLVGLPHVGAAAGEAEGREAHRLQGAVAREDHQVGPGDLACRTSA
jgi:hypothetical protein